MMNMFFDNDSNKIENTALIQYKSYYLKSRILEAIAINDSISFADLESLVIHDAVLYDTILWNTYTKNIEAEVKYLIRAGHIKVHPDNTFSITKDGLAAFRNELYTSLHLNAFFGYHSIKVSLWSYTIAIISIVIAIISIVISMVIK